MATSALYPTLYDEETRTWSGIKKVPLYDPNCSAGELFFMIMKNWPTQLIQITDEDGRKINNGEMRQLGSRLALYLKRENITQKDVVGIIGRNSTYVAPLIVGCFFNATPFHAVNISKETNVIKALYEKTKPKILFCDGDDYERIKETTKEWQPKLITLTGRVDGVQSIEDLLSPTKEEFFFQPAALAEGGDQTAVILSSSGTSGLPKAVALSHKQVTCLAPFCNSTDIILTTASIDWSTGFIAVAVSCIFSVPRIVVNGPFNAEVFIDQIKRHKVTSICLAPWQTFELFNHPSATEDVFATIRMVFITGGWTSIKVLQKAQSLVKHGIVVSSYGCTEAGAVTANIDHSQTHNNNNVGRLFPGIKVKILDDQGNALPHNEIGEVVVDIGMRWSGYIDNKVDTDSTLKDGWIMIGDLGYFDNDNNLYIVDRKKELLKYKSCHYWPNELEQIIAELPEVQNVCVVGIQDPRYGDAAGALVSLNPGSNITEQFIIDHVAKRVVVDYKKLHSGVKFVDSLPQSANGKVVRSSARKVFESLIA